MEQIKVVIITVNTCREVNKYTRPERKNFSDNFSFTRRCQKYMEIESNLRKFSISNWLTDGWVPTYNNPDNSGCDPCAEPWLFKEEIREAVMIDERTVYIITKEDYVTAIKSGRAFNGFEKDKGTIIHIVVSQSPHSSGYWGGKSLCGTEPGIRGNGWHGVEKDASCEKCLKKYNEIKS